MSAREIKVLKAKEQEMLEQGNFTKEKRQRYQKILALLQQLGG